MFSVPVSFECVSFRIKTAVLLKTLLKPIKLKKVESLTECLQVNESFKAALNKLKTSVWSYVVYQCYRRFNFCFCLKN